MLVHMKSDRFLKCVVDDNRRKILVFLKDKELSVNEIVKNLDLEQSLISHHLHMLKCCGLVRNRQDGKKVLYSVSNPKITKLLNEIESVSSEIKSEGDCK